MTDNIRFWLEQLYVNEIEEVSVAASNEHLWALGSNTTEEATQHEMNADELRKYIQILNNLKENIK